jgi:hypothetical protein
MYTLSWSAAAFAGPLVGGVTLDRLGRDAVWFGCAVVGSLAGAGYYLLLRGRPAAAAVTATDGTEVGTTATAVTATDGAATAGFETQPLPQEPVSG